MSSPSNYDLCVAFRQLMTTGAYLSNSDGEVLPFTQEALDATKPWRNDIWKAFREIEDRLCPVQAFTRTKEKEKELYEKMQGDGQDIVQQHKSGFPVT